VDKAEETQTQTSVLFLRTFLKALLQCLVAQLLTLFTALHLSLWQEVLKEPRARPGLMEQQEQLESREPREQQEQLESREPRELQEQLEQQGLQEPQADILVTVQP